MHNCQIRHFAAGNITMLTIIKPMPYSKLQYGTEIYIKYVNQRHDVCTRNTCKGNVIYRYMYSRLKRPSVHDQNNLILDLTHQLIDRQCLFYEFIDIIVPCDYYVINDFS